MPIYEYRCDDCGHSFEVMQKMADDPLETCSECGGALRKVLHPVAIHFKGSGFYTTDYGKGSGRRTGGREGSDEPGGDGSSASEGESDSKSSGSKSSSDSGASPSGDAKSSKDGGKPKEKQRAT